MRISSGMIFDAGVSGINRQLGALLKNQEQLSSGKRFIAPGDDPVAAARAVEVTQASDIVSQFTQNQQSAKSALGLEEAQLSGAEDLLQRVHELAVQASSASPGSVAGKAIANELRGRFDQLLGVANAQDAAGDYVFSGFMSDTEPFGGSVDSILAGGEITYRGDQGQRTIQVSSNRYLDISDSGLDVFRRIPNGNGYFVTDYASGNAGTATVNIGTISDPSAWRSAATQNLEIRFTVAGAVTTYDLVDTVSGNSILTGGAAPAAAASQRTYISGQPIVLKSQSAEPAFDLGGSITVTGPVASGDRFSIAPSTSQSVFATVANLIGTLERNAVTPATTAQYKNDINFAIGNIALALDNIVRVHAQIGSRMNEIDSLSTMNDDLNVQYQQTLSNIQDLDYAKAITALTRQQTNLEAAQQSFAKISQLSLFSYL